MNWLLNHWVWVLIGVVIVVFIISKARGGSTSASSHPMSDSQIIAVLIEAFDDIIASFLGNHYSDLDRRKIAIGMVAVMAAQHLNLDNLKNDPSLVVKVAAQSAAILTEQGEIRAIM